MLSACRCRAGSWRAHAQSSRRPDRPVSPSGAPLPFWSACFRAGSWWIASTADRWCLDSGRRPSSRADRAAGGSGRWRPRGRSRSRRCASSEVPKSGAKCATDRAGHGWRRRAGRRSRACTRPNAAAAVRHPTTTGRRQNQLSASCAGWLADRAAEAYRRLWRAWHSVETRTRRFDTE